MSAPTTRNAIWAESGQTTTPSQGEQQSGFVAGKPSRRKTNWILNWLDNAVQYLLAWGVPEYQAGLTYNPGSHTSYAGTCYQQVSAGDVTGVTPGTDNTKWLRWGHTDADVNDLAETKAEDVVEAAIGDLSGAVTHGDIVVSGNAATVAYEERLNFPGTTRSMIACRLTFPIGGGSMGGPICALQLQNTAAFEAGVDSVQATIGACGGNPPTEPANVYVSGAQEVTVQVNASDLTKTTEINILIIGH